MAVTQSFFFDTYNIVSTIYQSIIQVFQTGVIKTVHVILNKLPFLPILKFKLTMVSGKRNFYKQKMSSYSLRPNKMTQNGYVIVIKINNKGLYNYIIIITKIIRFLVYLNSIMKVVQNPRDQTSILQLSQGSNVVSISGDIESLLKIIKRYTIQEEFKLKFQLVKKLGQGAFAEVYSAKKKKTEDYFAVKMFEKSFLNSNTDKQSLLKEIKVLRIIYHNSCVSLLELYENQCYIYIVMELFKGGNLSQYSYNHIKSLLYLDKNAPLTEKQTAQIVYNLLISLNHINSFGIFHRDFKPDTLYFYYYYFIIDLKIYILSSKRYQQYILNYYNIVFREKGNLDTLCVTDFGLAEFYNQEGKYLFNRCGSVGFVAPEILHDCAYDLKVDLYSIGIIMYYAISGSLPFDGIDNFSYFFIIQFRKFNKIIKEKSKQVQLNIQLMQILQ